MCQILFDLSGTTAKTLLKVFWGKKKYSECICLVSDPILRINL